MTSSTSSWSVPQLAASIETWRPTSSEECTVGELLHDVGRFNSDSSDSSVFFCEDVHKSRSNQFIFLAGFSLELGGESHVEKSVELE